VQEQTWSLFVLFFFTGQKKQTLETPQTEPVFVFAQRTPARPVFHKEKKKQPISECSTF
jgi:hypothetical protein